MKLEKKTMDTPTIPLLLVDDQELVHRALERTLRREPYEIINAYDAAEAWAILRVHPEVRGIICDHYMPGTRGLELLREIRCRYPEIGTLLLTAQADLELAIHAVNEGHVHRILTKPWNGPKLRAQLREVIGGAELQEGRRESAAREEEKLLKELASMRDPETDAYVIVDPHDT